MDQKSGCLICGSALAYSQERSARTCALCGQPASSDAACTAGHFVCDGCHKKGALDVIESVCRASAETNPVALANQLMRSPTFHMHGPEHHFLVPAVLLTSFCNAAGRTAEKEKMLQEARRRSDAVLGGFCGFWGACGAAVGVGIFFSVATGATPLSTKEWRLSNEATARVLTEVARLGGPRCCKRDTFVSLEGAAKLAGEALGVSLAPAGKIVCRFSAQNRECLKQACPFFPAAE
ncbi:MAG TPA: DUF5714 domain-containing protein [Myxococcales bacterium]